MLVVQSVLMVLLVALSSGIHAQNATVLSQLDTKTRYTGCWGFAGPSNREFAVVGEQNGLWIVETTDPTQLVEVGYFAAPFSGWRESTELNGYVYSVSENHGGLRILDVRNPDAIIDHGLALETVWTNAHTISVDPDQGHVYVNGAASGAGMYVIDIGTNPIQPQVLTRYRESYVHDCYVRDGVAYLSEIFNGRIRVLDVTNLTAVGSPDPRVIRGITNGLFSTPGALTHNCWPTADGNLLLTTDETPTGDVRIYDITNPAMSLEVGSYGATGHVPHNVTVLGRTAHIAHYTDGYHMVDLDDPSNPTMLARADTTMSTTFLTGAWGVYALQDSGIVYVTDTETGLFVIDVACGHMRRFGDSAPGAAGTPHIAFTMSPPVIGRASFGLDCSGLTPLAPWALALSPMMAPPGTVLAGLPVHVDPATLATVVFAAASATGEASVSLPIPQNPALAGFELVLQAFSDDPSGPLGISASRGHRFGICQ